MTSDGPHRNEREYDLVLWGATGYTGRVAATWWARHVPPHLRVALAGRSERTVTDLRDRVAPRFGVVTADAFDMASLRAMASRTRAIFTTVGPYARYGTPLVAACVEEGTDLADITGEPTWMRDVIDTFHAPARRAGVRIVHACGFDSVPSDLAVLVLQREALARYGVPAREIRHRFHEMAGGFGGGTIATALDLASQARSSAWMRRRLRDPDLLAPGTVARTAVTRPSLPVRAGPLPGWEAPFVMAATNEKVVRRTRHLLGEPWGAVTYHESIVVPTWARSVAMAAGLAAGAALVASTPGRALARRFLPRPGEGPTDAVRAAGRFATRATGTGPGLDAPVEVTVTSPFDPGFEATVRMATEVCLALVDGSTMDAPGGVLTPAVAVGVALQDRLRGVGIDVEVAGPPVTGSELA